MNKPINQTDFAKLANLQDCKQNASNLEQELFIVEGASASSSVKMARNAKLQAVLALQGKPMNAAKARYERIRKDVQLQTLTAALGCGTGEDFDLEALRYQKILLLFDPDADGTHACLLLQVFLSLYMPKLLEASRVFIVRAPLMQFSIADQAEALYAYSPQHAEKLRAHLEQQGISGYQQTHFKGIASLHATTLDKLCLNPATRNQQLLSPADALRARQLLA